MASKDQFEAFKIFYTAEDARANSLADTAKIYLTLISLFFAYLGYKITDTQFDVLLRLSCGFVLYGLVFLCLLIGLASTLLSIFMHNYEEIADAQSLFERSVDEGWSDEDLFDVLITDMNVTTKINADVNDGRALKLQIAAYSLFAGFLLYGVVFLLSAWCKTHSC
jgi:hypothetical protein